MLDVGIIFGVHKGEICIAGSRVFVQEGIYDEFVEKISESLKSWVVGDPFDPNVNQGPQVCCLLCLILSKDHIIFFLE